MTLRRLHRISAVVITGFACLHLTNHLAALAGAAVHIAWMDAARGLYRQPIVEALLLFCIVFQVCSGLWLVGRGWQQRRGRVAWLQAAAGAYLAFFLVVHVSAVLYGRAALHLDTNFYFAAAGLHAPPFAWFFAPYYFLAVLALFTHLGCALYRAWPAQAERCLAVALGGGFVAALAIVLSLAGMLRTFDVPQEYLAVYDRPSQ
jgi:succinate dehydrogenase/fumarate reductase cytochrome b subunit